MPLVIMASAWESGYSTRYTTDFSWQIILGAYTILFFLYTKAKDGTKKDLVRKFMAFATVWAILVNGVQVFNFAFSKGGYPSLAYAIEQVFAFYK